MTLSELLPKIHELSKLDKLKLMQFLSNELVQAETQDFFTEGQEYPIWSPYHCTEAANTLMSLLESRSQENHD